MRNSNRGKLLIAGVALAGVLQLSEYASADETTVAAEQSEGRSQNNLFDGQPTLNDAALAARRGGAEVVSDMQLNGVVTDNQAYNLVTGGNSISEGAFAGASGMPMVIQNSGNNVLIQNATIVNVQVQ